MLNSTDAPRANSVPRQTRRNSMRAIGTGYECIEKTSSATFGGLKIRYAYLSQRGFYPDGTLNES